MNKKSSALLMLLLIGIISINASNLIQSRTSSYYKYIYRLNTKEASIIYKIGISEVNESFFHNLVDSIPTDSVFNKSLSLGNYLFVWAEKNELKFELRSYSDIDVIVHNNYSDLLLTITDKNGFPINDAKVKINNSTVRYKPGLHAYHHSRMNKRGWLEVTSNGFTSYHYLTNDVKKGVKYQRIAFSVPIKYLYIPAKLLFFLPYDVVMSAYKLRPQGIPYIIYSPFRDVYYSIFRYGTSGWIRKLVNRYDKIFNKDYTGYVVFSQPKYKPNDTVRVKAFITRPNGTPISRSDLEVKLYSGTRNYVLGKANNSLQGSYSFEFVLHDSLDLKLDKAYHLKFVKNGWNTLLSGSFKYEEYELNNIKYSLRVDNVNHLKGSAMNVYLKGEDMNGLNVPDGRVKLMVLSKKSYLKSYNDFTFLPDTLYVKEQLLDPVGETIMQLPDSLFPCLDFRYDIRAEFLTSDNERIEEVKTINYYYNKKALDLEITNDSILFIYKVLDKNTPLNAEINSYDRNGNLIRHYKAELPFQLLNKSNVSKYEVKADSIFKVFGLDNYLPNLSVSSFRKNHTVDVKIDSHEGTNFNYFIYKRNIVLAKGYTNKLDTLLNIPNSKGCYISLNYVWGGKAYEKSYEIPLQNKQLQVKIIQPDVIYPGQKVNLTVEVNNFKNKPVSGVDITVWGNTKKFNYSAPVLPNYSFEPKSRTMFNKYYLQDDNLFGQEGSLKLKYNDWNAKMNLDTITYYQFTRPENGIDIIYEDANDEITQFAPFVFNEGAFNQVHFIYMDYKLLYSSYSTIKYPYSFRCDTGYHKVRLRTYNRDITIDSVYFESGKKHLISIDWNKVNRQVKSSKVSNAITYEEQNYIKQSFARINTNGNYGLNYLKQGDNIYILNDINRYHNYYRRGNNITVGPFHSGYIEFKSYGNYSIDFEFEPSYEYSLTSNKIKMKSYDKFWTFYPLKNSGNIPDYSDMVLTEGDIKKLAKETDKKVTQRYVNYNNPYSTTEGNGCLALEVDNKIVSDTTYLNNVLVFKEDNPLFMRIYPASVNNIHDLKQGEYRLFFSMSDGYYFEKKNISVNKDGLNILQISRPVKYLKDSTSSKIQELIQEKWISKTFNKPEPINQWKAEKEIRSTYQKSQLDYSNAKTIIGQVVDDNGEPLPGVTVMLKGTDVGTITDFDGNYKIDVPKGSWELVYSFIGFRPVEIPASYHDHINVVLEPEQLDLDEVVVIGYGVVKKSNVTGSVVSVKSETLSGMVAGVSGVMPGIKIRGVNSVNSSKPLIIVDGIAVEEEYGDIDPQLIANVEILKDAAATSIYGARASNGVIIISTKEGHGIEGLTQINDFVVPVQPQSSNSIRSNFSDFAFWQPALVTNKQGKVSFQAVFPDDITSWNTYALAMGPHKTTGQFQGEIKSFKPVSAQLSVPRFLTEGDSVLLIGKALNYLSDTIIANTSYGVDSVTCNNWNSKIARVKIDTLPVVANGLDTLSVTYSITEPNGFNDGELRKIPIVAKGMEEVKGQFYTLSTDSIIEFQIPDNAVGAELYIEANPLNLIMQETSKLRNYIHLCNEQAASKLISLLNEKNICDYKGEKFKYNDDVNKLIKRLEKSVNREGVWGWWKDLNTEWWITSHVTKALEKARKEGYQVNYNQEQVKYELINHFLTVGESVKLNVLQTLKVMDLKSEVKSLLNQVNDSDYTRIDSLNYSLIKQYVGMPVDVTSLLKNKRETLYGSYYWGEQKWLLNSGDIAETLLAYQILKNDGHYNNELAKIRNYFFEKRSSSGWRNTYESALIIDNILTDLLKENDTEKKLAVSIKVDGQKYTIDEFPYEMKLKSGSKIEIEKTGSQVVFAGYHSRYFNDHPNERSEYFDLKTSFVKGNQEIDHLVAGEKVELLVDLEVKRNSDYIMLEVPIPSVCSYNNKTSHYYNEVHREYFKDKVCIYYRTLNTGHYKIKIELVPRYTGKVTINPTRMEHMYFPVFNGNNKLKSICIE